MKTEATEKTFTYADEAPRIPKKTEHTKQRWFEGDESEAIFDVYRNGDKNFAEVSTANFGESVVKVQVRAQTGPAGLRDLAARLLRAADHIEAHPAPEVQ